ncbi:MULTISPECIES: peptidylprolyl isomerase [Sinorhizobium]|jgi:cyclophilin family peptidyl-prolyl cis-trans isomerase|uniref:peptidylprolyl isomerase n=1 Tax=Sinorhizobium TaxID=28105 RepID=UPI00036012D4|nr:MULTISPECIES: peptidylprolyl isomerase [Sinorhizobium]PND19599.1 peptidylprolyl isomerase [Ensifer sp. MMN_5]GCA51926.1 peptidyl-prolyl cis-trans isomerase A precursor [Sinorhizobium sp. KGO-5]PND24375.1 peptidylprolyl isomerase [Sinorhizobium sp. M4_45]WEJ11476.1 peptidylprolyl isomerase [Sinorhizobium sp. M103]WEJ16807.1 peptidylprolyl isomerase [Sinorhizobium sp. K101]
MKILQFAFAGALALATFTGGALAQSGENILTVQLKDGPVVIELRPDIAPKHVQQIKELAAAGEYDNVAFHRVIKGFMAQTGDVEFGDVKDGYQPDRAGTGGSSKPNLPAEFSDVPFERGTVGMARAQDPNSANSQFFIMFAPGDFLNGQYTVVGKVVEGMENVDKIKLGDDANNGAVADPDRMISVKVGR